MTATADKISISAETVQDARATRVGDGTTLAMVTADGQQVALPPRVQQTLLRALASIAERGHVTISEGPRHHDQHDGSQRPWRLSANVDEVGQRGGHRLLQGRDPHQVPSRRRSRTEAAQVGRAPRCVHPSSRAGCRAPGVD